jgi:hypothetical protein
MAMAFQAGTRAGSFILAALLGIALSACNHDQSNSAITSSASSATSAAASPTIAGTPNTSVAAGTACSFQPTVSSAGGGALTFSIQNMPSWATFSKTNGLLSGTHLWRVP